MKNIRSEAELTFMRCARKGGGLFLGVQLHFPVAILDVGHPEATNTKFRMTILNIGFVVFQIQLIYRFNVQPANAEERGITCQP